MQVQKEIEATAPNSIPRELTADFADIARRVRSETWGLRLLRPIVRAEPPVIPSVTQEELCAYAGLLIKVGALSEARKLLSTIDSDTNTNVLVFLGQVCIAQWNYQEAAIHLKRVLGLKTLNAYQRCIAEVNLASAYVFLQKFEQADKLLPQILKSCIDNNWELLYGNALEISAQLAVIQGHFEEADSLLQDARTRAGQHSHYSIFIQKWSLLSELKKFKSDQRQVDATLTKISQLREEAEKLKSWETMRDLDYHVALHLNHQNLLLNVYFGTPHLAYKKRIEKIFKDRNWQIPEYYYRKLSTSPATRTLDLSSGVDSEIKLSSPFKPGQSLHRLLNILAMDFYKPVGLGEIFSKLFPEEYFNPDSSGDRVSQAVKRLRSWFEANTIPLEIRVEANRYSITASAPYALKIPRLSQTSKELLDAGYEFQIKTLREAWPYQSFSAGSAAKRLSISTSSVRNTLKRALNTGILFSSGAARSTLYRFKK